MTMWIILAALVTGAVYVGAAVRRNARLEREFLEQFRPRPTLPGAEERLVRRRMRRTDERRVVWCSDCGRRVRHGVAGSGVESLCQDCCRDRRAEWHALADLMGGRHAL